MLVFHECLLQLLENPWYIVSGEPKMSHNSTQHKANAGYPLLSNLSQGFLWSTANRINKRRTRTATPIRKFVPIESEFMTRRLCHIPHSMSQAGSSSSEFSSPGTGGLRSCHSRVRRRRSRSLDSKTTWYIMSPLAVLRAPMLARAEIVVFFLEAAGSQLRNGPLLPGSDADYSSRRSLARAFCHLR